MAGPGGGAGRAGQEAKARGEAARASEGGQKSQGLDVSGWGISQEMLDAARKQGYPGAPGASSSSRGVDRPIGTRSVPNYPISSLLDPTKTPSVPSLVDAILNGTNYNGMTGTTDITTRDMGLQTGSLRGTTGAGQDRQPQDFNQFLAEQQAAPAAPGAETTPKTLDEYLASFQSGFIDPSSRYYLEQRGLFDPNSPDVIPQEWQDVFGREFGRIKSTLPPDLIGENPKDADVYTKLRSFYSDQFGKNALDAEENRRRNAFQTTLGGKGWNSQLDTAFGDTSDDTLIESIINPQYTSAQTVLENQRRRGQLTPQGFNYASQSLGQQRDDANTKLQGIGAGQRASGRGSLDDYIKSIQNQAGAYTLGDQFDPNAYDTEFGSRLTSASGALEGNIRGAAPTNLFDTSKVLQDASSVQGQTNRGGLLDVLSRRNRQPSQSDRGLGTTGSF